LPDKRIRKVNTAVRIDARLFDWIESRAGPGQRFASITHAVECGIVALIREEEAKKPSTGPSAR